ncbi:hypothetical protein AFK24_29560 [Pseudomonas syringae]|uniref:Uncharacterized protein n=1 Tax=Pseudomonas syringae TaxID=317 RepID=A0A1C7YXL8_PSESX|nr:hypothetical protein AFK24_29560 [Pseudomonas syringae]
MQVELGWGQSIVIGVAGAAQEFYTRPFQLVTGRTWKGSAFGGVKGRTQLPKMVEDAMKGEIEMAPFVTHTMPLERINEAFDLMYGRIENKDHAFYGLDFVHTELSPPDRVVCSRVCRFRFVDYQNGDAPARHESHPQTSAFNRP